MCHQRLCTLSAIPPVLVLLQQTQPPSFGLVYAALISMTKSLDQLKGRLPCGRHAGHAIRKCCSEQLKCRPDMGSMLSMSDGAGAEEAACLWVGLSNVCFSLSYMFLWLQPWLNASWKGLPPGLIAGRSCVLPLL